MCLYLPFFWTEKRRQEAAKREREFFERVLLKTAEQWDEDKTKFKPQLVLHGGDRYKMPQLFDVPTTAADAFRPPEENCVSSPHGRWYYFHLCWPRGLPLGLWQNKKRGHVWIDEDTVVPVLRERRPDHCDGDRTWMSMTPMELLSSRSGVRAAKGKVVLGGLGMGWLLQKIAAKPSVKEIVVIEKDEELLDWIRPAIERTYPHVKPKVTEYIVGDAREHLNKHGEEARHLLDIWDSFGDNSVYFKRSGYKRFADKLPRYLWCWA